MAQTGTGKKEENIDSVCKTSVSNLELQIRPRAVKESYEVHTYYINSDALSRIWPLTFTQGNFSDHGYKSIFPTQPPL
jgi:hypothetical protein